MKRITIGAAGCLVFVLVYLFYVASYKPNNSLWGPTLWQGPNTCLHVALTFDDGPTEKTPKVLRILEEQQIVATFFLVGQNVERYPHIVQAQAEAGHGLGNHTYTHSDLIRLSPRQIQQEIEKTQAIVTEVTGQTPQFFRPPYGRRTFLIFPELKKSNLRLVTWSIDPVHNWNSPQPVITTETITQGVQPGSIILLHDTNDDILHKLPDIISSLKNKGYTFVSLRDLLSNQPCRTP